MTTPATDGKMIVNALYHSAVVSVLAMGYARLGKMAMGVAPEAGLRAPWRRHGDIRRRSRNDNEGRAN